LRRAHEASIRATIAAGEALADAAAAERRRVADEVRAANLAAAEARAAREREAREAAAKAEVDTLATMTSKGEGGGGGGVGGGGVEGGGAAAVSLGRRLRGCGHGVGCAGSTDGYTPRRSRLNVAVGVARASCMDAWGVRVAWMGVPLCSCR
jgi:hypothetical protein